MRAARIIALAVLVYSSTAISDLTIRYDSVQGKQRQAYQVLMLKGPLLRVNPASKHPPSVLVDVDSGDIVQLHAPTQRYFRVNADTIDSYVDFYRNNRSMVQGFIDHGLARFAPAQKTDIEALIRQFDQRQPAVSSLQIRPTGKMDEILGARCRVVSVYQRSLLTSQVCIADYAELGLDQQQIHDLDRLKAFALKFRDTAPKRHRELFSMLAGPNAVNGVPLKIVHFQQDGSVSRVIVAASISLQQIPRQAYHIPDHFQQLPTPIL
jgi:hypothetical protein